MRRKIFSIRIDPEVWKTAREKGLNISRICENALKQAVQQKGGGGTVGSPLVRPPGFEPGIAGLEGLRLPRLSIDWARLREKFCSYAYDRYVRYNADHLIRYLDRFLKEPVRDSTDILKIFRGLSVGQQHHLNRALRALFNYLEILGWSREWLDSLRKAIPKDRIGIDLHVPEPGEILEGMKKLPVIPLKYRTLWNLCLESGTRLLEAIRIIGEFREEKLMELDGFCRYEVAAFRGSKQAYYAYFLPETLSMIRKVAGIRIERRAASSYFSKRDLVSPKYLRKFAFDRMIQLGVPESVADFIEGRVPRRIGAKHYMALRRQADKWYPRYAEYLKDLRKKAGV